MADLIPLPHTSKGRKGPPVVAIHGFGGDRSTYAALQPEIAKLRRTIALDLPGHGAAADWPETPDAGVCAKAVIDTLDGLKIKEATLIGHSLGGAVASIVGLMRPDLVERLILLCPGGFGEQMNARLLRRYAAARTEHELALVMETFFGPAKKLPESLAADTAAARADDTLFKSLNAIVKKITRGDGQGTLPLAKLAAQPFPMTLVWGDQDYVLPFSHCLAAPAEFARHILPGVGHMPQDEEPELVLKIITQALVGRA